MQHGLDFYAANDDESQVTHRYQLKEYGCYTFELTSIEEPVCFDALEPVSWPSSMWSKRRKATTTIFLPTSSSVALLSFFWFTFLYEFLPFRWFIGWKSRQDLQKQEAALIERWKGGRNSQTQGTFAFDWYILFFFLFHSTDSLIYTFSVAFGSYSWSLPTLVCPPNLVDSVGGGMYYWWRHAAYNGTTMADLCFPSYLMRLLLSSSRFMFCMGMSLRLSVDSHCKKLYNKGTPSWKVLLKISAKVFILVREGRI